MIDLKFLDMTKINFAFTDDEKLLDLSEIAIGLPKEDFKKIIDYNQQNLFSLWMARAMRAHCEMVSLKYDIHNANWIKWQWVERKCMDYAKKFIKPAAGPLE